MLHNSRMILFITLGLTCVSALYSADDQHKAYRLTHSYYPENPPIIRTQPSQPIKKDYSFTEQLLKDEIRTCGTAAVRARMQEAIKKTNAQREGKALMLINLITFNRIFFATSTDSFSHSIFDKAAKDGAQKAKNFSQQPSAATPYAVVFESEEIYTLDANTHYRVLDETMQTIESITGIHDQDFIEKTIADIQQNG